MISASRVKGVVAWAGLAIVLWLLFSFLVSSDMEKIAESEYSYLRKQALLHRLEALPDEEEEIRKKLEVLSAEATARFLYAGDDNNVRSLIQRDLREIAGKQIKLGSMRLLGRSRQEGPLESSSVQIKFTTTYSELVSFLQRLEAWEPLLKVRRLSARVRQASTNTSAAELAIVLDVTGFRRTERTGS